MKKILKVPKCKGKFDSLVFWNALRQEIQTSKWTPYVQNFCLTCKLFSSLIWLFPSQIVRSIPSSLKMCAWLQVLNESVEWDLVTNTKWKKWIKQTVSAIAIWIKQNITLKDRYKWSNVRLVKFDVEEI